MNKIIASLKDKRFRYGSFSTAMVLFVIALFLLVNLVAGQLNVSKDLTQNKMYSLSRYTKEFLGTLEKDVTIYALFKTGQENLMFKQLLEEYAASSSHISVVYRDPVLYPAFVESYAKPDESIADNSVIVVSGNKHKIIHAADMVTYDYDYNTWQQYVSSIDIEPQVSNAINYVTLGETSVIYSVTGNNEIPVTANLVKQLELSNYEMREADLLLNEIPGDCDILFITTPSRDWSDDEAERVLKYLQNDGRAIFLLGYSQSLYPTMNSVLAAYGVALGDYIVIEGDTRYYMGNQITLIGEFVPGDVTQNFIDKRYVPMMYQATGIDVLPLKKTSTKIEPLIVTSPSAYGKSNPESETINKEPGDTEGPFNLAVTVTDSYYTDTNHYTKMVVLSSIYMLSEGYNNAVSGTNWEFIVNSVNWLQGQDTSIYIPSKSPYSSAQLSFNQAQAGMMALVSVIILPIAIIAAGLVIWFRRRHN